MALRTKTIHCTRPITCACCSLTPSCLFSCGDRARSGGLRSCLYLDVSSSCPGLNFRRVRMTKSANFVWYGCAALPQKLWTSRGYAPCLSATADNYSCGGDVCFSFECQHGGPLPCFYDYSRCNQASMSGRGCEPSCWSLTITTSQRSVFSDNGPNITAGMIACGDVVDCSDCVARRNKHCDQFSFCQCGDGNTTPFMISGTTIWDQLQCPYMLDHAADCCPNGCGGPMGCGDLSNLLAGCPAYFPINVTIYEAVGPNLGYGIQI